LQRAKFALGKGGLCRVPDMRPSAKGVFAEGQTWGTRHRRPSAKTSYKKNGMNTEFFLKKNFAEGLTDSPRQSLTGFWPPWPNGPTLPRASGASLCRGLLGLVLFAEGQSLSRAPGVGPRQRVSLPSVRDWAPSKASCPRQRTRFE